MSIKEVSLKVTRKIEGEHIYLAPIRLTLFCGNINKICKF